MTFVPVMVPLLLLMAAGPYIPWRRADLKAIRQRLTFVFILCAIGTALFWGVRQGYTSALSSFGLFIALWIISATAAQWAEKIHLFKGSLANSWARIKGLPRSGHGMSLAHIGLGVALIGMVGSSHWSLENLAAMKKGALLPLGAHCLRFEGVDTGKQANYQFERAKLVMLHKCKTDWFTLQPETRLCCSSNKDQRGSNL